MISLESQLAGRLVKSAPEPWNDAAVTIPVTFTPVAVTIPLDAPRVMALPTLTVSKNVDTPVTVIPPPTMFTPLRDVVTPVIVAPPPTTLIPDFAVTIPVESTLVTSS